MKQQIKIISEGVHSVIMEDHEYIARYMPDGNQWVPWVFFIYKDRDGVPVGTSGQGYKTLDDTVEAIKNWHTGFHWDGWLNPRGEFFPVSHGQHSIIVDLFCPKANGDSYALLRKNWLIMRHGDFSREWNWEVEITTKQYDWIEARWTKWGKPLPEICNPKALSVMERTK